MRRRDGAGQRHSLVEHDPEPHAHDRVHRGRRLSEVGRTDRQSGARPSGPRDAPVAGAGDAVVPPWSDDERVQPQRSGNRACRGAVLEGGERLRHAHERHPCSVERDPVQVRIDRVLEPGDQLIRSPEDRPAPARLALPAGDPDRQDRRTGRDAFDLRRPLGADEQAGELGPVPLETGRVLGARLGTGVGARVDGVVAGEHLAEDVRLLRVDARVQERDRDSAAVEARQRDSGPGADARREPALLDQARRDGGRIRDADRIHARHLGRTLEIGDRARVERSREAGHDAGVAVLRLDQHALLREARDQEVVGGERRRGPLPLLRLGRLSPGRGDPVGKRRAVEDDDHALADRDLLARAADETAPGRPGEVLVLAPCAARSGRHREQRRGHSERAEHAQLRGFTPP